MNDILSEFNKKWKNQKVPHCDYLFSQMRITKNKIYYSCNCINNVGGFPFFHQGGLSFSKAEYINNLTALLTNNLKCSSICGKCKYGKDEPLPELTTENIQQITFDFYKTCNGNCIYCFAKKVTETLDFIVVKEFIDDLLRNKMINKTCIFRYGGGEITLYKDFDKLYNYVNDLGFTHSICTSGIIYSKTIEKALKDGNQIIISPDSGSEEVFKKVKRTNSYNGVWQNISQYAKHGDNLQIKYVIFCLNSQQSEIEEFMRRCTECNIKHIIIDCEIYSGSNMFKYPAKITQKELRAAIHLKNLCIENNIKYSWGYYWNDNHLKQLTGNQ